MDRIIEHLINFGNQKSQMNSIKYIFLISITFLISCSKSESKTISLQRDTIFQKVDPSYSNITFANNIKVDLENGQSLFDYDYFYNGAGVGIADVNNDGLQDIFFCGNQVSNRLYINKGNLKFKDVSQTAGINTNKNWASGVTFADVNNDGWLDIYISQGGPLGTNRKNCLYINQKNSTFKESAESYGLDDAGISTQSVFFDYDNDGDLDCLVMNENPLYGIQPQVFHKYLKEDTSILPHTTSRLYQNEKGKFHDVTKNAGLLHPTFGLGLIANDINNDGWLDIYISNDYYIPDALYINQQNGTFIDEIKKYTKHTSFYGMGVDMADINNDGHEDIFGLDMASQDHIRSKTLMPSMNTKLFDLMVNKLNYQHQYMYNSLQLSNGNNKFVNVAHLSGMAKTDWSWAGLLADLDNDGDRDVYITNGYRKYGTDNDFLKLVRKAEKKYPKEFPLSFKKQLYDSMPSEKLINNTFENKGSLNFKEVSAKWGFNEATFSNGAAYGDLDNDGDLELVVNNIDNEAFLYKNLSVEKKLGNFIKIKVEGHSSEPFAKVILKYGGKQQTEKMKRVRGYLSACENSVHFGVGDTKTIDTVRVEWLSGAFEERYNVKTNQMIDFKESKSKLVSNKNNENKPSYFENIDAESIHLTYSHIENVYNDFSKEVLLPYKQSTLGPVLSKGDLNGDSYEDIFIGGASGQAGQIYFQTPDGFTNISQSALIKDNEYEDMEAVIFDFDNDEDNDLYIVSGGNSFKPNSKQYKDRLYLNDGKGQFTKSFEPLLNDKRFSGKAVAIIDYNKDGNKDLIVTNRIVPQNYPISGSSFVFKNEAGKLKDVTSEVAIDLSKFGIINKVIATDFDNDGWEDFIVVGEWTHIGLFKNFEGIFKDISKESGLDELYGWWFTIGETDINNDGLKDYIIGNLGENSKYHASKETPLKVFADDFDKNGNLDIVLSYDYKGKDVPFRGRECSSQQMPFIAKKFKTYESFANASLKDIFGESLGSSFQLEATEFRSILLVNQGKGKFKMDYLPKLAQTFPLLSCDFKDFDGDGYEDVILVGNIYNTEVETPRLDGGTGLVLISNGKDNYSSKKVKEANLFLTGNVKSITLFNHKLSHQEYIISLRNNDKLSVLKIKK